MERELEHPYWELYSELISLKATYPSRKDCLRRLALKADLSAQDILATNLLISLPGVKFARIERVFFGALRERFAYSVLSREILEIVSASSPLVELAAGNGYIAWLLQQLGADIVAIEPYPVEEGKNWFFNTRFGLPSKGGQSWMRMEKGSAGDLTKFSDRTLLLCWPPKNAMASDALRFYSGHRIILISEKSCCANAKFFRELERDWLIEYSIKTGSWSSCHEEVLEIYSRRGKEN